MKLLFLMLILFLGFDSLVFSQSNRENPLIDTVYSKNNISADVDWISASIAYKRKFSKKWSVGISTGYGKSIKPVLNSIFIGDYEVFHVGIPVQFHPHKLIYLEITPRYAYLIDNYRNNRFKNNEHTVGLGTGFFIGGKTIQYGFKTMFGRTTPRDPDYFISNSYLVIRFSIITW